MVNPRSRRAAGSGQRAGLASALVSAVRHLRAPRSHHTRLPARYFATHLRALPPRRGGGATSSEIHRIRGIALAYRIEHSENLTT